MGHFCPLTPLMTWKIKNFEKMKKAPGYVIILHIYTKNLDHDVCFLRYGVQQRESVIILGQFLPFYPTNNPKNQNFEKIEKEKNP